MNVRAAVAILLKAYGIGVRDICVCAGARNSPLIEALGATDIFQTFSFFDERAASFFALGRSRRDRKPIAIITTSGTAVAELLPAVIEAWHTQAPLLLITADRPVRLRGTGAPQSMVQPGVFGGHVEWAVDWQAGEVTDRLAELKSWRQRGPAHLNICFDEPLIDSEQSIWGVQMATPPLAPMAVDADHLREALTVFKARVRRPLAVVGPLAHAGEQESVRRLLQTWQIPAYIEGTSGLRGHHSLQNQELWSGEGFLNWALQRMYFDGVVRLGGVPTARLWRDLETSKLPVLSLSGMPLPGLSHGTLVSGDLTTLASLAIEHVNPKPNPDLIAFDRQKAFRLQALLQAETMSEAAWVERLSGWCESTENIYIGNSLPIRQWDLVAQRRWPLRVNASRGVNGIDGQLSTFFGGCLMDRSNMALVGDLTALYDLNAPWILPQMPAFAWQVVVLNNGGGQIFNRLFKNDRQRRYLNQHGLRLKGWAEMWHLSYRCLTDIPSTRPFEQVIEIVPDASASEKFWGAHDRMWSAP